MAQRGEIESHLAAVLAVNPCKDYGPNGLQVEGRADVGRGVPGVTTCETGVAFLAFRAPATQRYRAAALGQHLANRFLLQHRSIEFDDPA